MIEKLYHITCDAQVLWRTSERQQKVREELGLSVTSNDYEGCGQWIDVTRPNKADVIKVLRRRGWNIDGKYTYCPFCSTKLGLHVPPDIQVHDYQLARLIDVRRGRVTDYGTITFREVQVLGVDGSKVHDEITKTRGDHE